MTARKAAPAPVRRVSRASAPAPAPAPAPTPTPSPVPVVVETELQKVENILVKAAAIASTVVGGISAAKGWLPTSVASVFVAAGPFVYAFKSYEKRILAELHKIHLP